MNRRHTQRHWGTLKQDDEGTWEMSCKTQADCARRGGQHTEERILRVQTDEGASEAALSSLPCPACISSTDGSCPGGAGVGRKTTLGEGGGRGGRKQEDRARGRGGHWKRGGPVRR